MKLKYNIIALTMLLMWANALAQDTIKAKMNILTIDTIIKDNNSKLNEFINKDSSNTIEPQIKTEIAEETIDSVDDIKKTFSHNSTKLILEDTNTTIKQNRTSNKIDTIELHISDIAKNYNLQREFIDDSNALKTYLATKKQNFAEQKQLCQKIATNARTMIADLDLNYTVSIV